MIKLEINEQLVGFENEEIIKKLRELVNNGNITYVEANRILAKTIKYDTPSIAVANTPKHLAGLNIHDMLIIKNFPPVKEYGINAKYLLDVIFEADYFVCKRISSGFDCICGIHRQDFGTDHETVAESIIRRNGYTGNLDEFRFTYVYSDMVEILR